MLVGKTVEVNDSTATVLVDGTEIDGDYTVHLQSAFDTIIGGDDISTANGFGFNTTTTSPFPTQFTLQQGEKLYGVATSGTHFVGVLLYNA